MADAKKGKASKPETTTVPVVTCPACQKKFKPKADMSGKKIKCPLCTHAFVVPLPQDAGDPVAVPVEEAQAEFNAEYDADPDPYGMKHIDMVPRCPNCTEEMGPHDIICLSCGYNTLTREWGKSQKTIGVTFGQQFKYLLPALGTATFMFFSIVFLIYYCVVSPYHIAALNNWVGWVLSLSDHESMRMWTTVMFLMWIWAGGMFCFKKFIEKPKPDEIEIE
jgi:hypothetical protein